MKRKILSSFLVMGALALSPLIGAFSPLGGTVLPTTVSATSNNTVETQPRNTVETKTQFERVLENAEEGTTVRLEGVTTLSIGEMRMLLEKDVTLVMEYTYQDVQYVVTIPAGSAVEEDVPWCGPLYLAARFGNGRTGATYTVRAGDTLSRIAQENGMTLNELMARNPQITNANFIVVGQQINLE